MKLRLAPLACLALIAACDEQPDPLANVTAPSKPPEQVCAQAREGIKKLAEGGLETDGKGGATFGEETWLRLPGPAKEQMIQLVAYDAACRAAAPAAEQNIEIRSEYGRVMEQRVVPTAADLTQLSPD